MGSICANRLHPLPLVPVGSPPLMSRISYGHLWHHHCRDRSVSALVRRQGEQIVLSRVRVCAHVSPSTRPAPLSVGVFVILSLTPSFFERSRLSCIACVCALCLMPPSAVTHSQLHPPLCASRSLAYRQWQTWVVVPRHFPLLLSSHPLHLSSLSPMVSVRALSRRRCLCCRWRPCATHPPFTHTHALPSPLNTPTRAHAGALSSFPKHVSLPYRRLTVSAYRARLAVPHTTAPFALFSSLCSIPIQ